MVTTAEKNLDLVTFDAGMYIEIDDVVTGERKMARVAENGISYDDLADQDSTALPIYASLNPAEVGNILGWGLWLVDHRPDDHPSFKGLVDRLIHSGQDPLTYNRAAHWAFQNHEYDYAKALDAGIKATERVRASRKKLDSILRSSGVLQ